jgi:hypothetical protein
MWRFLHAGGVAMWIVIFFSLLCLFTAARYAWRPDAARVPILRALTWAAVFAIISGVTSNFMAVMWHVTDNDEWAHDPDMHLRVMHGLGEAVTPAILGFTMLALTWLLVAAGARRARDA